MPDTAECLASVNCAAGQSAQDDVGNAMITAATKSALPPLAVTGATGAIGGQVARILADAGMAQRLLVRNLANAPHLPRSTAASCSYGDHAAASEALSGVDLLFMVSASESADRLDQHRTFIDAAASAGVGHIIYTSFMGAAPDAVFTLARDHYFTEEYIKASGMGFTFLRDNFYIDFLTGLPGEDGVIRGPAGDGRVAAVARADVARVVAAVLQDPGRHRGITYDLTGPEALDFFTIADILGAHTGMSISYHNETIAEAYESRKKWDAPGWQYDAWVSTYTAIATGTLAAITGHVETITGQHPMTLAQYLSHQTPD
ncbi:MAG: NAD(P)-dependent oxidoreductase [Mycobacterium sp.]|nr:NAD(P)-dependent oxidoreductase [Mycobacterium sp.]